VRGQHRVLIVDDQPLTRDGVAALLEKSGAFTVCGQAGTAREGREKAQALQPDLIILDLLLGGHDGADLVTELLALRPSLRILVYSSCDERIYAPRVLRSGARGYVMKNEAASVLLDALAAIATGKHFVSPAVQNELVEEALGSRDGIPVLQRLSNQELRVFRLIGNGLRLGEIATELNLSVKTIGTYCERLKNKVGVATSRELHRKANRLLDRNPF